MPFVDGRAGRRKSRPCSTRHIGVTRHLHLVAGACGPKLFARRLCRFGLIDARCRATPVTRGRGQTGVSDQWWHWLGQDDSAIKTLLGWRIAAVPDGRSASLSAADEYVSWARL